MDLCSHIDKFARRLSEVEAGLSDPRVFEQKQRYQELSREYARLKDLVAVGDRYRRVLTELNENRSLAELEAADSEMGQLAREEIVRLENEERRLALEVQRGLVPPDATDGRNTIIEIRAGAGGSEAALFAADLYRM